MFMLVLTKQDSLEHSSVHSIYTLSCSSLEGYMYAIMCSRIEAGLIPSSPFTIARGLDGYTK